MKPQKNLSGFRGLLFDRYQARQDILRIQWRNVTAGYSGFLHTKHAGRLILLVHYLDSSICWSVKSCHLLFFYSLAKRDVTSFQPWPALRNSL